MQLKNLIVSSIAAISLLGGTLSGAETLTEQNKTDFKSWRDLKETARTSSNDVHYFEFKLDNGSKAHLAVIDLKSKHLSVGPVVNTPNAATSGNARSAKAIVAVNGGYFNLSNGLSTSYIVLSNKVVCDPRKNPALMTNPKLRPFMPQILGRTELRFSTDKKGKQSVHIEKHGAAVPSDVTNLSSLQAGPRLLPQLTDRDEAFVRTESDGKEVDSIGVNRTAARTTFGITKDGHGLILCVAGNKQDEFSSGATLSDVASTLKKLGCESAINFDGGTSTTMVVNLDNGSGGFTQKMVCGREPETHVKSVLVVAERP